jgi:hypothetical protein
MPSGSWNHLSPVIPTVASRVFTSPYCGWKTYEKTVAAATVDVT